ncbi:CDP-glycerol glycerophosphotransferase family protein [Colwellia sp. Arc7-D]|uniref:CDP-glycerol glycerophosphotransferase family protein n=1 Tax=Colwellia sp. Arc7-D TaxID=2161872 RepID=UPI000D36ABC2|nr:CDP-glycerol glycerophosphotransferase family protein [Colwellia sp. Arc7-D]AWB56759.1 hypothetical protein DBO93_03750 [Colwellia sp. Arc7-D]
MYKRIITFIPKPIKNQLKKVITFYINKTLSKKMRVKHQELLTEIKNKDKIKVVFLVIQHSVWKVDSVFKRMQNDPFFDPVILICPYISNGEENMIHDLNAAYNFFKTKNYPVVSSLINNGTSLNWLKLKELQPDLIFFTNPHKLTRPEYHSEAYLNYLTCYVPYHHEVVSCSRNLDQYNQVIHNGLWRIFAPHQCSKDAYNKYCTSKDGNVLVTGYPSCEDLYNKTIVDVWKYQEKTKLKIIWAPHHTIDNDRIPYSNFLQYADLFTDLIKKTKDHVQWVFKPHPMLKYNLYSHSDWGENRTEQYYNFWHENENTQLEEGEYAPLFQQSDALIHDSGSFLAEYLYLKKPVLFTARTENYKDYYNDFGLCALSSIKVAKEWEEVLQFVNALIDGENGITREHYHFIEKNIEPFFNGTTPSKLIVDSIKHELKSEK